VRKEIARPVEVRQEPRARPARAPYVLTLSSRRIVRRTLPADGFAIGSGVRVVVEHGRVTLFSGDADGCASGGPAVVGAQG